MLRAEKGITLVALIITIIILVILAAVTITTVYSMGLVNYLQNGAREYTNEGVKENETYNDVVRQIDAIKAELENIKAK